MRPNRDTSETPRLPTTWIASINTGALGEYLECEIAMRNVEERIELSMKLVLHDSGAVPISARGKPAG